MLRTMAALRRKHVCFNQSFKLVEVTTLQKYLWGSQPTFSDGRKEIRALQNTDVNRSFG